MENETSPQFYFLGLRTNYEASNGVFLDDCKSSYDEILAISDNREALVEAAPQMVWAAMIRFAEDGVDHFENRETIDDEETLDYFQEQGIEYEWDVEEVVKL